MAAGSPCPAGENLAANNLGCAPIPNDHRQPTTSAQTGRCQPDCGCSPRPIARPPPGNGTGMSSSIPSVAVPPAFCAAAGAASRANANAAAAVLRSDRREYVAGDIIYLPVKRPPCLLQLAPARVPSAERGPCIWPLFSAVLAKNSSVFN